MSVLTGASDKQWDLPMFALYHAIDSRSPTVWFVSSVFRIRIYLQLDALHFPFRYEAGSRFAKRHLLNHIVECRMPWSATYSLYYASRSNIRMHQLGGAAERLSDLLLQWPTTLRQPSCSLRPGEHVLTGNHLQPWVERYQRDGQLIEVVHQVHMQWTYLKICTGCEDVSQCPLSLEVDSRKT